MITVSTVEGWRQGCRPFHQMGPLIAGIGRDSFADAAFTLFDQAIGIDHVSLFRLTGHQIDILATASSPERPALSEIRQRYLRRFTHLDPVRTIPSSAIGGRAGVIVSLNARDINHMSYRRECYEAFGIQQRVTLAVRYDSRIYQLNLYRLRGNAPFESQQVDPFVELSTLVVPTFARHAEILTGPTKSGANRLSLEMLRQRISAFGHRLSERELEVCARALYGQSIAATALALQIGKESVITYRRRAYIKLGVSCSNELFARLMA